MLLKKSALNIFRCSEPIAYFLLKAARACCISVGAVAGARDALILPVEDSPIMNEGAMITFVLPLEPSSPTYTTSATQVPL